MAQVLSTIGFDADDTLWHNERFFQMTQVHFAELLAEFTDKPTLMQRLLAAEKRNLGHYGFGVKGFTLSMIETAIEVTSGRVSAAVIAQIMDAGREMLRHPVDLLPHARAAVEMARQTHRIVLITKGDLLDQERKLAQSGLGDLFHAIEIVSDKTRDTYRGIFARHGTGADHALMVGNSMRSDVLPMIEAGGWGVFVHHGHEWDFERAEAPSEDARYHALQDLGELSDLIAKIESP
ncbi:HAD family hydrolase [uncultured Roseobacter sp.]|uniref:HAD family hydrolase n=1 Tax=uncultured Roseobacter sp. TaxID=114847 RepID=UPI0026355B29|nr:HAD family hydrolase [uncultured Roseobacter sp.]